MSTNLRRSTSPKPRPMRVTRNIMTRRFGCSYQDGIAGNGLFASIGRGVSLRNVQRRLSPALANSLALFASPLDNLTGDGFCPPAKLRVLSRPFPLTA